MRLGFREVMRGTLRAEDGSENPVEFDVTASGEGAGFFALDGTGQAPPWLPEASASGTLEVGALLSFIRYRVRLTDAEGKVYTLEGEKRPSVFAPLTSMTEMPVRLLGPAGGVLGEGSMSFDLGDLPAFLLSWLPLPAESGRWLGEILRLR